MITIQCYGEDSFGGRTSDEYVIYDFDNLEEFKKSINKNEFTSCKEIKRRHKIYIVIEDDLVDRIVNFSNYIKIKETDIDLVSRKEYSDIFNNLCKHCARHDGTISEMWDCSFYPTSDKNCKNYKGTLMAKYRRKFKGINVNKVKR